MFISRLHGNTAANPGLSIVADAQQSSQWWDVCLTTILGISQFVFYVSSQSCQFSQDCSRNPLSRLLHSHHSIHSFTWRHRNHPIICLSLSTRTSIWFWCCFLSLLFHTYKQAHLFDPNKNVSARMSFSAERKAACMQPNGKNSDIQLEP